MADTEGTRESGREHVEIVASGTWTETVTHPAWAWRCWLCGGHGAGLTSEAAATREANDHLDTHTDEEISRG